MKNSSSTPTVVLVIAVSWTRRNSVPVIRALKASGLPVFAPANPQRGLASGAEYMRQGRRSRLTTQSRTTTV
jgi:hypothetical protein